MARVTDEDRSRLDEKKNKGNDSGDKSSGNSENMDDILKNCSTTNSFGGEKLDFDDLSGFFDDDYDFEDKESTNNKSDKNDKTDNKDGSRKDRSNRLPVNTEQINTDTRSELDRAFDLLVVACENGLSYIWKSVKITFSNIKKKTGNDLGLLAKNLMIISGILLGTSVFFFITRLFTEFTILTNLGLRLIVVCLSSFGVGLVSLAVGAYRITSGKDNKINTNVTASNLDEDDEDMSDFFDDEADDIMDLIDDEDDIENSTDNKNVAVDNSVKDSSDDMFAASSVDDVLRLIEQDEKEKINSSKSYKDKLKDVKDVHMKLNRAFLYDTFKDFFKTNCTNFMEVKELDESSSEYKDIEINTIKALAAANNKTFETVATDVDSIFETISSYIIRAKRILGLNNLEDIRREVENYFKDGDDSIVTASVTMDGDDYKIIVNKNKMPVITLGDTLKDKEVEDFIRNEKNVLPFVIGINDIGNPIYRDAKHYNNMMIAGQPRSGKSWTMVSLLVQLMAFNTPEDVQFIIIDPKKSPLLTTMALMPHVAGLHSDNVNMVLGSVVKKECERRAKLLLDTKCDDIWELRNRKNIKIPVLYIVIDEFISVCDSFKERGDKDGRDQLNSYISTIVTQMPSKGVRLILIPHRAEGYVEKTIRKNMSYLCTVQADDEVVKTTLGIKKFERRLINPGDSAILASGDNNAFYAKGIGITPSNEENRELLTYMAKSYYKFGFEAPTTKYLGYAANRDEEAVRRELDEYDKPVSLDDLENDDISIEDIIKQEKF